MYVNLVGEDIVILVIYIDDLIITGSKTNRIKEVKENLCKVFDMTDLGLLDYCLGLEVGQKALNIFISQASMHRSLLRSSEWRTIS